MSRRRVTVLLAIMAALAGAPSSASAAHPNQLSQGSVTPSAGDTSTLFVVTVRYRSPAGNPASAVSASAGGRVTAMTLVSGTTLDGTWSGTGTLPPGDWDITVEATVATGPKPTLLAGSVSVAGGTAPPPSVIGTNPSTTAPPGGAADGPATTPAPQAGINASAGYQGDPGACQEPADPAPSQPPTRPAHEVAAPAGAGRGDEAPARTPHAERAGSSAAPSELVGCAQRCRHPGPRPGFGRPRRSMLLGSMVGRHGGADRCRRWSLVAGPA